jgi:ATP-dependent helicase HrpB
MTVPSPAIRDLPITAVLDALRAALASRRMAILQAPPGAGKTTRVPLALLDEPWLGGAKIVMLEPRRLAARAAAGFMARLVGERIGGTVGYRVRLDTRVGPRTRIEVITEGILGRMLQDDPALDGIGLVILDEFHERSIHADVGLALTLQTRSVLRDDLRILVMSATLDGVPIAALLGDAPIVTSDGRLFPVETRHVPRRVEQRLEAQVASTIRDALASEAGDLLVFLPGMAEIRRVATLLEEPPLSSNVRVLPLHGALPLEDQDLAIAASPPARRKVVLATSIAETSLTIDGVRVVIDSGLMRVPRFSPRTGMTRLETIRVSRASADQRRGRAGRIGAGVAYRLWSEPEEAGLVPHGTPEILEADLAPLALMLAGAGVADPAHLAWLDPPPAAAYAQARDLLGQLGALDGGGAVTAHGNRMSTLPVHPRLAHMMLAAPPELAGLACDIAALLGERDVLRGDGGQPDADLGLRLEAMRTTGLDARPTVNGATVDRDAVRRAREQSREWRERIGVRGQRDRGSSTSKQDRTNEVHDDIGRAGSLLALAYPDRIAQRRTAERGGRFLLRNGRGAVLSEQQSLSAEPYLVVAELDDQRSESRILLAAPITLEQIEAELSGEIVSEEIIEWDPATRAVIGRRRRRLGALVLADAPLREIDPERIATTLLERIRSAGLGVLHWSDTALRLRDRMTFMARQEPGWPDVSDHALLASMDEWLLPHLSGLRRLDGVRQLDLADLLRGMLDWKQRTSLDERAPTHLTVPSGSRIPIDYSDPEVPILSVRLQEMFGCTETPRIAQGRVPLTIHLLSPANRPVQVTRDLAGFWRTSYFEVRKQLRGRYPKHRWPDDPLAAAPTNRAKRRR